MPLISNVTSCILTTLQCHNRKKRNKPTSPLSFAFKRAEFSYKKESCLPRRRIVLRFKVFFPKNCNESKSSVVTGNTITPTRKPAAAGVALIDEPKKVEERVAVPPKEMDPEGGVGVKEGTRDAAAVVDEKISDSVKDDEMESKSSVVTRDTIALTKKPTAAGAALIDEPKKVEESVVVPPEEIEPEGGVDVKQETQNAAAAVVKKIGGAVNDQEMESNSSVMTGDTIAPSRKPTAVGEKDEESVVVPPLEMTPEGGVDVKEETRDAAAAVEEKIGDAEKDDEVESKSSIMIGDTTAPTRKPATAGAAALIDEPKTVEESVAVLPEEMEMEGGVDVKEETQDAADVEEKIAYTVKDDEMETMSRVVTGDSIAPCRKPAAAGATALVDEPKKVEESVAVPPEEMEPEGGVDVKEETQAAAGAVEEKIGYAMKDDEMETMSNDVTGDPTAPGRKPEAAGATALVDEPKKVEDSVAVLPEEIEPEDGVDVKEETQVAAVAVDEKKGEAGKDDKMESMTSVVTGDTIDLSRKPAAAGAALIDEPKKVEESVAVPPEEMEPESGTDVKVGTQDAAVAVEEKKGHAVKDDEKEKPEKIEENVNEEKAAEGKESEKENGANEVAENAEGSTTKEAELTPAAPIPLVAETVDPTVTEQVNPPEKKE